MCAANIQFQEMSIFLIQKLFLEKFCTVGFALEESSTLKNVGSFNRFKYQFHNLFEINRLILLFISADQYGTHEPCEFAYIFFLLFSLFLTNICMFLLFLLNLLMTCAESDSLLSNLSRKFIYLFIDSFQIIFLYCS